MFLGVHLSMVAVWKILIWHHGCLWCMLENCVQMFVYIVISE